MIRIMTDTAADIPSQSARELGIEILPFMIHLGDRVVRADIGLEPEQYYEMLRKSGEIPTTSQMSPADVESVYRRLGKDGDAIIHVTMSGRGSGIYNTSCMVAEQLNREGFDITVIDSAMFAYVIGHPVEEAARMAAAGKSKEEIVGYLQACYRRDTAYFVVDDLTFLKKGGRIKATTMAISALLDIKPILNINDGLVEAYKKVRGLKRAMAVLADYAQERMEDPTENSVYILHSDAPDKVEILSQMVKERLHPAEIVPVKLGPIITSHAGMGLVGIYFKHKQPFETYGKN